MEIHETGELDEKLAESAFASHDGSSQGRCWSRREGEREREFRRNGSMISGNQRAEKSKQTRPVRRCIMKRFHFGGWNLVELKIIIEILF